VSGGGVDRVIRTLAAHPGGRAARDLKRPRKDRDGGMPTGPERAAPSPRAR